MKLLHYYKQILAALSSANRCYFIFKKCLVPLHQQIVVAADQDLTAFKRNHLVGAKYVNESSLNLWYSGEPFHVQMCALALAHSVILGGQVSLRTSLSVVRYEVSQRISSLNPFLFISMLTTNRSVCPRRYV